MIECILRRPPVNIKCLKSKNWGACIRSFLSLEKKGNTKRNEENKAHVFNLRKTSAPTHQEIIDLKEWEQDNWLCIQFSLKKKEIIWWPCINFSYFESDAFFRIPKNSIPYKLTKGLLEHFSTLNFSWVPLAWHI